MNEQLTALIDSLIATGEHPASWAYQPNGDDAEYFDCSPTWDSEAGAYSTTQYRMEVGDGDPVAVDLDVSQLRELHRKLTLQLAVIARQSAV